MAILSASLLAPRGSIFAGRVLATALLQSDFLLLTSPFIIPSMPISQRLRDPLFLLCLTAALLAFVVQSGELATSDTTHRLQTTHWLWTSEPQVFPNEYPEFGLHGRGGAVFKWYGIGASLFVVPAALV